MFREIVHSGAYITQPVRILLSDGGVEPGQLLGFSIGARLPSISTRIERRSEVIHLTQPEVLYVTAKRIGRFKAPAAEAESAAWKQYYNARGRDGVAAYLASHPFLEQLLLEAWPHIERCFGPGSEVNLEVVTDWESEEAELELGAFIQTELEPEEALERLDRFDASWWLEALPRSKGNLEFHLEFQ